MNRTQEIFIDPRNYENKEFFLGNRPVDPRIQNVVNQAEEDYYRDRQRASDLTSYNNRKKKLEEY